MKRIIDVDKYNEILSEINQKPYGAVMAVSDVFNKLGSFVNDSPEYIEPGKDELDKKDPGQDLQ